MSWTTNVADVAPAVATLGRPLQLLRIPVDDWAVALALALRAFPMLLDEFRLLYAARQLRPAAGACATAGSRRRRWAVELVDLLAAGVTVALRARRRDGRRHHRPRRHRPDLGGARRGPTKADWVALGIVAVVGVAAIFVEMRPRPDAVVGSATISALRGGVRGLLGRDRVSATGRRPRNISSKNGLMA